MNENVLIKKDCILYCNEHGYCNGLKVLECAHTIKCPFYKSKELYNRDGSKKVVKK